MAILEWSDSLSVGFEEIDDDHKNLLKLVNQLDDVVNKGKEGEVIGGILDELLNYTAWHFRHEERLMQTYGDPEFFNHKNEHEKLTQIAAEQKEHFLAGDLDVENTLLPLLKNWLTKHILETDMKTGKFLAENTD